jgi:hypothetical protein
MSAASACLPLLACSILAAPIAAAARAAGTQGHGPAAAALVNVRATTPQLTARLQEGRARSATFRALVDRLEAEKVLIYVLTGQCRRHDPVRLAGCLVFLGTAGGLRHFRIVVDDAGPSRRVIATIGHEMQHAVEIVDAGISTSDETRPGTEVRPGVYETEAALRLDRAILAELGNSSRTMKFVADHEVTKARRRTKLPSWANGERRLGVFVRS